MVGGRAGDRSRGGRVLDEVIHCCLSCPRSHARRIPPLSGVADKRLVLCHLSLFVWPSSAACQVCVCARAHVLVFLCVHLCICVRVLLGGVTGRGGGGL